MLTRTLTVTRARPGSGVARSWRAHPEARSPDSRVPPALRPVTRAPNEHMETIR